MTRQQLETRLRKWAVAQWKLSEDDLRQLWSHLEEQDYVEDAIVADVTDEGWKELQKEARRWACVRKQKKEATLDDSWSAREVAVARYLAKLASTEPEVGEFRRQVLRGGILSPEEAHQFLASPAPRYLSLQQFWERGIPVIEHRCRIIEYRTSNWDLWPYGPRKDSEFQDPSRPEWTRYCMQWVEHGLLPPHEWYEEYRLQLEWEDGACHEELFRCDRSGPRGLPELLNYPDERGVHRVHCIWPHSVLDELRETSRLLVDRFQWEEAQAVWFVLTDEPVPFTLLDVKLDPRQQRVSYSVHTAVPAEVLKNQQRSAQRQLRGSDPAKTKSGASRSVGEATFGHLDWIAQQLDDSGRLPGPRELWRRWNRDHPDDHKDDPRDVGRLVERTVKVLVPPAYQRLHQRRDRDAGSMEDDEL
jgi:hypothetical protein